MDWINEMIERFRIRLKNMSLKRALLIYIIMFILGSLALSFATTRICNTWENLIYSNYKRDAFNAVKQRGTKFQFVPGYEMLSDTDRKIITGLDLVKTWCPYVYAVCSMAVVLMIFYRRRLAPPFFILQKGVHEIKNNNLDFEMQYDSVDEMGQLCIAFEEMRRELIHNKEAMWILVDEQKKLNAAFAHDLRTPLTVLRGYSDFLVKYLPEGKISEEKLIATLELMTDHIKRLEQYTNTMKNIHSIEEIPVCKREITMEFIMARIMDTVGALNQIGFIHIRCEDSYEKETPILADENIILEVVENLLSNSMRYAKTEVIVSAELEGEMLFVYVEDDGKGFSKADMEHAIQPYYRGEEERRTSHFGIGLHICSSLCERHGGQFSVSNRMAGGAIATASFQIA